MKPRVLGNRARYDRIAGFYGWFVRSGSFGRFDRFYRAVADALEVGPGARVLDMGCGPGTLTPYLLKKVGPTGSVLGTDISGEMIERARAAAREHGWRNARFERSDARDFQPDGPLDAVVFCLSLTTMPEPERCFSRAVSWLEPGGRLVILDSFLERERRLASLVVRLKSPLVGADPTSVSRARLASLLESVRVQPLYGGVYTVLSGRRPQAGARPG